MCFCAPQNTHTKSHIIIYTLYPLHIHKLTFTYTHIHAIHTWSHTLIHTYAPCTHTQAQSHIIIHILYPHTHTRTCTHARTRTHALCAPTGPACTCSHLREWISRWWHWTAMGAWEPGEESVKVRSKWECLTEAVFCVSWTEQVTQYNLPPKLKPAAWENMCGHLSVKETSSAEVQTLSDSTETRRLVETWEGVWVQQGGHKACTTPACSTEGIPFLKTTRWSDDGPTYPLPQEICSLTKSPKIPGVEGKEASAHATVTLWFGVSLRWHHPSQTSGIQKGPKTEAVLGAEMSRWNCSNLPTKVLISKVSFCVSVSLSLTLCPPFPSPYWILGDTKSLPGVAEVLASLEEMELHILWNEEQT